MISKSPGPWPDVAEPEEHAGRAGEDVDPLGARSPSCSGRDGIHRLDLPAGGAHPGDARVHLEVDVPVVAPVAATWCWPCRSASRSARRRATRSAPTVPLLDESDPLTVRGEERARRRPPCRRSASRRAGRAAGARGGSRRRRARCTPCARPSGESAIRAPPVGSGGCSAWFGRSARLNWVSSRAGPGRSQPQSAAAAATASAAPSADTSRPGPRRAHCAAPVAAGAVRGRQRHGGGVRLVLERLGELAGRREPVGRQLLERGEHRRFHVPAGWCAAGS